MGNRFRRSKEHMYSDCTKNEWNKSNHDNIARFRRSLKRVNRAHQKSLEWLIQDTFSVGDGLSNVN